VRKLKLRGNSATVILPEMSVRVFILPLEKAGLPPAEHIRFIEWRLGQQLSRPLNRIRYSHQTFNSTREQRVLVVCTGEEVAEEYENLFAECQLKTGKLTIPSLSVLNLIMRSGSEVNDFLLIDTDLDYLSLIAVLDGAPYLYRQKQLWPDNDTSRTTILKETENTINFIEDKTRKRPALVYLRTNLDKPVWLLAEVKNCWDCGWRKLRLNSSFWLPWLEEADVRKSQQKRLESGHQPGQSAAAQPPPVPVSFCGPGLADCGRPGWPGFIKPQKPCSIPDLE